MPRRWCTGGSERATRRIGWTETSLLMNESPSLNTRVDHTVLPRPPAAITCLSGRLTPKSASEVWFLDRKQPMGPGTAVTDWNLLLSRQRYRKSQIRRGLGRGRKRGGPARQAQARPLGAASCWFSAAPGTPQHPTSAPDSAPQKMPSAPPRATLAIPADPLRPLEKLIR